MLALMMLVVAVAGAGEKASPAVVDFVQTHVVPLGTDPVIVAAVRAENAKRKSLDQIKEMDAKWTRTPGVADYMKVLMESECGSHLRRLEADSGLYAEIFVMDNQGANVCMTDKTSDYWQGDEAKFQRSYGGGSGAVFVDDVAFDESSQKYVVQASVPVRDGAEVIGAVTVSLDLDAFESR